MPIEDDQADLVLSLSGLHMVARPDLAARELTRCLKPGGELVGTTFVRDGSWRQRKLFELGHRSGHALPPRSADLVSWLQAGGIEQPRIEPRRGFAVFRGRRALL